MEEKTKLYSEMERYEIINISNGEKYNYLLNNDIIVDEYGCLKFLIVNNTKSHFSFFGSNDYLELPWDCVSKIGAKTIIVDVEENEVKKSYK
jgi:YlmC/YmxH family sporulation protein